MLIVTIAALVMAASLGWFAFRLMQEEQRRSEARVALLTAALDGAPVAPTSVERSGWDSPSVRSRPPAAAATTPAAIRVNGTAVPAASRPTLPSIVHLEDDTRGMRRFASEVAGEPEQIAAPPIPLMPLHRHESTDDADVDEVLDRGNRGGLFAEVPGARSGDARRLLAIAGLVIVAVLALGYVWFGRAASPATTPESSVATGTQAADGAATPAPGGVPLELLSLTHDQRGSRLVVRGLVRNPVAGSDRAGLVASVLLLDQAGGFLGSGRAPLDVTTLKPGDDVGFAVQLPADPKVRRYRVTFRAADGALVPHADRRK